MFTVCGRTIWEKSTATEYVMHFHLSTFSVMMLHTVVTTISKMLYGAKLYCALSSPGLFHHVLEGFSLKCYSVQNLPHSIQSLAASSFSTHQNGCLCLLLANVVSDLVQFLMLLNMFSLNTVQLRLTK